MKKGKRILSLLLATLMILSLAACGGTGDTTSSGSPEGNNTSAPDVSGNEDVTPQEATYPLTTEKKTLSVYIRDNSSGVIGDYGRVAAFQAAAERLGVELEFVHPTTGGEADQFNLMIGSGKYPDIIVWEFSTAAMGLSELIDSGILIDMDGLIRQYAPNYLKVLERDPSYPKEVRSDEGKYQAFYTFNVSIPLSSGPVFREDLLAKYGLELPKTVDEWTNVMTTLKEKDPNVSYPLTASKSYVGEVWFRELLPAYNTRTEFCLGDNGQVVYGPATENFKAYLEFLNGLYAEGLLEVEYTSLDRDQVIERISNDLTGVAFDFSWAMSMMYSNVLPYYDGTADTAFVGAAPLSSADYKGFYVGRVELGNMFGVNASSSKVELACKFLDYAMSEPCQEMYQWGIEGESYTVDASGNKSYTEQASDNDWLQQLGINPSFVFPAQQSVVSTDALVADWHAECNAWQEQFVVDPWPFIYSTADESEVINTYMVDIETYVNENATAFITGTKSLDNFDSYIEGLDALKLQEVLTVKQNQYSRYYEALNK